jgi:threonine dehydratase
MTLEILEQKPDLDALVIAVGGGSQAVGAMTVARALSRRSRCTAFKLRGRRQFTTHGMRGRD